MDAYDASESSEQSHATDLQKVHGVGLPALISESSTVVDDDESSSTTAVAARRLCSGEALSEQLEPDEDVDLALAAAAARARLPPRLRRRGDLPRPLTPGGEGSFSPPRGEGATGFAACLGLEGRTSSFFCAGTRFCVCTGVFARGAGFTEALRGASTRFGSFCFCTGVFARGLLEAFRGALTGVASFCVATCVAAACAGFSEAVGRASTDSGAFFSLFSTTSTSPGAAMMAFPCSPLSVVTGAGAPEPSALTAVGGATCGTLVRVVASEYSLCLQRCGG